MDRLAGTAQWTAAARAVESQRPDRLFDDPWADRLAGPAGHAALARHDPAGNPFLALRTWWFDAWCARAAADRCRQIVLLAAGLDTRAYRLGWPRGTVLYELDRPELLAEKDRVLAGAAAAPGCDRRPVGVDLAADWTAPLRDRGFDPEQRTGWLAEGLLVYLTEPAATALLAAAARLTTGGGQLAADVVGASFLTSPWTAGYLQGLAEAGVPWRYGTDHPETLLATTGWRPEQVLQPAEVAPASRPWPWPPVPREVPDVPRSYLATASRQARGECPPVR